MPATTPELSNCAATVINETAAETYRNPPSARQHRDTKSAVDQSLRRRTPWLIAAVVFALPNQTEADEHTATTSNRQPLDAIFDESIIADNMAGIRIQAQQLPAQDRFDVLLNWVLPSPTHTTIRFSAYFTPTRPVPSFIGDQAKDNQSLRSELRDSVGDNVVSPALDLVATAKQLNRLDDLRQRVIACHVLTESQQRCRLALLSLTEIAQGDFDAAVDAITQLQDRHRVRVFPTLRDRWPETLTSAEALRHPQLHEVADQLLQRMLREQVRRGSNNGPDPWDRLIFSLVGQLKQHQKSARSEALPVSLPLPLRNWFAASRVDAGTCGLGLPVPRWEYDGSSVGVVSHHNNDYLYYRIPLSGDYQVECDVTGFDYRDGQLLVAGTWVGPRFNHQGYQFGDVRQQRPHGTITPRLSEIGEWMRVRAVVRNRQHLTFVNGRLIHQESLPRDHDPWLALRVPFQSFGRIRDVCVTGQPVIPETLNLSGNGLLSGWTSYFGGDIGHPPDSDWWHETDDVGRGVIVGRFEPSHAGVGKESLFQYHRPVIEDGVIEYEFFYEPGRIHVHPSIGRRTLLLEPDGVKIHQITDAHFDSTGADPLNAEAPAASARAATPVLLAGEWNRLSLQLNSDDLTVNLNGQNVFRGTVDSTNDRTFGLFHYAGETEARVRNITWKGDWPRTLPAEPEQELRDSTADRLKKDLPQLIAVLEHDFTTDGLPRDMFSIDRRTEQSISSESDGLHVDAEKTDTGYSQVSVSTALKVFGDFDITASFEGVQLSPTEHGKCDVIVQVALTDKDKSHHAVGRSRLADPGRHLRDVVEHQIVQFNPLRVQMPGRRAEEVTSATLRLTRRGDRIYSFVAAGNSTCFRLIHVGDVVTDSSQLDGVRLIAGMNSSVDGHSIVGIVWKHLTVRAERLAGPAISR